MFIVGVLLLGPGISLVQNGLSAFDQRDQWGPFLIVWMLFGLPFGHTIVREWRRNRVGDALGFHFAPTATLWRDGVNHVWIIPCGCVARIHVLSRVVERFGWFADSILITDRDGEQLEVPYDFDLTVLWRALRTHHPEARATYAAELENKMTPRRPTNDAMAKPAPTDFTILATPPAVPPPPAPPSRFYATPDTATGWQTVHDYLRALCASQGITVDWRDEQPMGVTPVYLSAPLQVQWQTLMPIAGALDGSVGDILDMLDDQRASEWISARKLTLKDWTDMVVDESVRR